jgi:hypothetical protein
MKNQPDKKALHDAYRVSGFRPRARVEGYEHTPPAFVITLERRQKKRFAKGVAKRTEASMTDAGIAPAISSAAIMRCISTLKGDAWSAKRVGA